MNITSLLHRLSCPFILAYLTTHNVWTCVQFTGLDWVNWGAAPLLGAVTADVLHRPVLSTGVTGDLLTREIKKKNPLITALNRGPPNRTPHAP